MPSASETLTSAPRVFVRSLNLLLKLTRLYGSHHIQTAAQLDETWKELQAALELSNSGGLVIGMWRSDLLVNGEPIDTTAAEQSLAESLAGADIVSLTFAPDLKKHTFARFIRVLASPSHKPQELFNRLKSTFGTESANGIRINEIRYVATDLKIAGSVQSMPAVAPSMASGTVQPQRQEKGLDAQQLIQLIALTEASGKSKTSGYEFGEEWMGSASGLSGDRRSTHSLSESEMAHLLRLVVQLNQTVHNEQESFDSSAWEQRFAKLSAAAQLTLREALTRLSARWPAKCLDDAAMLRLGEEMVIHYIGDRLQHGEIEAKEVRHLLASLGKDIEPLRGHLDAELKRKTKKDRLEDSRDSYTEVLYRLFWSSAAEPCKRGVLLSASAWCVPPQNIQPFVEELLRRGEREVAEKILAYYAGCVSHHDTRVRKIVASGLNQLASLFTREAGSCLDEAVRAIGEQLAVERDAEVQSLLGAAFVRFSQEAATKHSFPAVRQTLDTLASLERSVPSWTRGLRPRIGIVNRIPEFIEQGLQEAALRPELGEVLRRVPQAAADHLAERLMRVTRSGERERIVEMGRVLGPRASEHLQHTLQKNPGISGVRVLGLLSRIDAAAAERLLPGKIEASERETHDEALRQLSVAAAPERGRILSRSLEYLDPMVVPLALDEIGMSADSSLATELLAIAEGELLPKGAPLWRIKALESVGRLRNPGTVAQLRNFVEARRTFRWAYPAEIRLAAAQALLKIDPAQEQELLRIGDLDPSLLAHAPLDPRPDRDFIRYRRYPRVVVTRPVQAVIQSKRAKYEPTVQVLSLEGGLLTGDVRLPVGTAADLKISSSVRPIHLEVLVRFSRTNQAGFETVGMELADRGRLRNLLVSMSNPEPQLRNILTIPS
jgi:Ca2+-binding EF-hand superfamily protein